MSRHVTYVPRNVAIEVFGAENLVLVPDSARIGVVHGYDYPMHYYFCDVMPECEVRICYGNPMAVLTETIRLLDRWEYRDAVRKLGLTDAADAVEWDTPY